jgi:hypothetical protein
MSIFTGAARAARGALLEWQACLPPCGTSSVVLEIAFVGISDESPFLPARSMICRYDVPILDNAAFPRSRLPRSRSLLIFLSTALAVLCADQIAIADYCADRCDHLRISVRKAALCHSLMRVISGLQSKHFDASLVIRLFIRLCAKPAQWFCQKGKQPVLGPSAELLALDRPQVHL